jgi:predicted ABC-type transport system involved in lysophospholipase L1 biosynthesis ATPase subunit
LTWVNQADLQVRRQRFRTNRTSGTSFLLVTHNLDLARRCDRIIEVVDGRIRS